MTTEHKPCFGDKSPKCELPYPDSHYALLRGELESDHQNLEAESWGVAVDQNYLRALTKEEVKRQEVIYGKLKQQSLEIDNPQNMFSVRTFQPKPHLLLKGNLCSLIVAT